MLYGDPPEHQSHLQIISENWEPKGISSLQSQSRHYKAHKVFPVFFHLRVEGKSAHDRNEERDLWAQQLSLRNRARSIDRKKSYRGVAWSARSLHGSSVHHQGGDQVYQKRLWGAAIAARWRARSFYRFIKLAEPMRLAQSYFVLAKRSVTSSRNAARYRTL